SRTSRSVIEAWSQYPAMRPGPRLRSVGKGERGRVRDRHFGDDPDSMSALRLTPASAAPAGGRPPGLLDPARAPAHLPGLAAAIERSAAPGRRIVAVIGDGALTGGMAYEGLNNLGHAASRVVIVLNDNGRSYAPTVSRLSQSWTALRPHVPRSPLAPLENAPEHPAQHPASFFESLGVRYAGPFDGHDVLGLENALREAAASDGPVLVHVLTRKGRGYAPAECDDQECL